MPCYIGRQWEGGLVNLRICLTNLLLSLADESFLCFSHDSRISELYSRFINPLECFIPHVSLASVGIQCSHGIRLVCQELSEET